MHIKMLKIENYMHVVMKNAKKNAIIPWVCYLLRLRAIWQDAVT